MNEKEKKYLRILKEYDSTYYQTAIRLLETDQCNNIIYKTGVLAVAPILYNYISWVIEEARKKQIKRLYFLSRDGYIMKLIASNICNHYGYDLECRYLYCSRIAWRIPQYHLEKEKCLDKICINSVGVNIDKIFDRANLTEAEKEDVARQLSIDENEMKRHLQWYEIMNFKERLSKCTTFLNYVYKHSIEAYKTAIGYLKQEGLFDDCKYALVDTGWIGSMQTSLSCLLKGKKIEGFYFGMYNLPKEADAKDFHTFLFSKDRGLKYKIFFNNNLFECLCSSPDGMTIGYQKINDTFAPVFASKRNLNLGNWDLDLHINTMLKFTEELLKQQDLYHLTYRKSKKMTHKLCKEFMVYPSSEEVKYGEFKFSDDVKENNLNKLAAELNLAEIKQNLLFWRLANWLKIKKYNMPYKQSCWIEASIVKCQGINVKKYIRHILLFRWVQYLRMKIFL